MRLEERQEARKKAQLLNPLGSDEVCQLKTALWKALDEGDILRSALEHIEHQMAPAMGRKLKDGTFRQVAWSRAREALKRAGV